MDLLLESPPVDPLISEIGDAGTVQALTECTERCTAPVAPE